MPGLAIVYGILMIILGVAAYYGTGATSTTALIPAFLGLPAVLLGLLARAKESLRMHAMHVVVLIALVALIGGIARLVSAGVDTGRVAFWIQLAMIVFSGVFMALAIKSFIDARRAREAGE